MTPLWRHAEFRKLWTAETISQLGSQMTMLALPLVAISVLGASVLDVGVLGALEFVPFVVLGLPAGVWIDRLRRRPILVAADLGRAVVLGSIPLAAVLGVLSIAQLYAVAFVAGSLTVMFDLAYEAFVPGLIGRDQLADGNAKLELSRSGATIAGPAIAGTLVGLVSAPFAILLDAVSFVGSAAFIFRIRAREAPAPPAGDRGSPGSATRRAAMRREIADGLRYVLGHRYLRPIACCTATANLFFGMANAVLLIYLVREIGLGAARVGLVLGVGNVGFLIGAVISERARVRLGVGPTIVAGAAIGGVAGFLVPAAPWSLVTVFVAASQLLSGLSMTLYNINQVSLRQSLAPERLRGRITATMRFVVWGTLPIGTIAGGAVARVIGTHLTLWIAAAGGACSVAWVALSPVRAVINMPPPDREVGEAGEAGEPGDTAPA